MRLIVHDAVERGFLEGARGAALVERIDDVSTLIGACFEHEATRLLLYPENLPAGFFDLSTGEAGAILQKLRTYHLRLAVVHTPALRLSQRFGELMAEENQDPYFRLFDDRQAAVARACAKSSGARR